MTNRIVCLLLMLVLLCSAFTVEAYAEAEEPLEITVFYGNTASLDRNEFELVRVFEEKTNTKWNVIECDASERSQKINALCASGSTPDIMCFQSGAPYQDAQRLIAEGYMRPVEDLVQDMPNFIARWDNPNNTENVEGKGLELFRSADGQIYCFPNMRDVGFTAFFARTDWMENLGLTNPVTLDEYYELMRAFTFDDPDQNGVDDTYGVILQGSASFCLFCGPYGLAADAWQVIDGELYWSAAHPRMKDALVFAKKCVDDGLVMKESLGYTNAERKTAIASSKAGIWHNTSSSNASLMLTLQEDLPNAGSHVFTVPVAEGVEAGMSAQSQIMEIVDGKHPKSFSSAAFLSSDLSDEKAIRIAKMIDWFYSDECSDMLTYGIEGKSFNYDENGEPQLVEEYQNLDMLRTLGAMDGFDGWGYFEQKPIWHYLWAPDACENMANTAFSAIPQEIYFTTPLAEELTSEIESKRKEIFTQCMNGEYTTDEAWDLWMSEFDRIGGNDMVAEMRAEYARRMGN